MTDEDMLEEVKDLAWKLARSFNEDVHVAITVGGKLFTAVAKVEDAPLSS
jgi:hypothetical protein